MPARSTAALIATAPSSLAASDEKSPWKPPIGVRAAPTITTGSLSIDDTCLLVDDAIGALHERSRYGEIQCTRRFHVDHEVEPAWLVDRDVAGLHALDDLVDIRGGAVEIRREAGTIADEPAIRGDLRVGVDGRDSLPRRELDDARAIGEEHAVGQGHECVELGRCEGG